MIVPQQVQHTVGDHVGPVGFQGLVLLYGFPANYRRAQDDVAEQRLHGIFGQAFGHFEGEGQHIGGLVLVAVFPVEGADFVFIDDTQGDIPHYAASYLCCMANPVA